MEAEVGRRDVALYSLQNLGANWGGWSSGSGRFSPRKDPVPIVQDGGWASGPVWMGAENLAAMW